MSIIGQPNLAPARMRAEDEILMLVTCDFPLPTTAVGKLCSHNMDNNTINNIIMSAELEKMHYTSILMIKCGNSFLLMFSEPWASSLCTKFRSG